VAIRAMTALSAAVAVATRFGVRVTDPAVLSDGANLVVHLGPAPVVARVATLTAAVRPRIADSFAQEIALSAHLHNCGVPVVSPATDLPPGPHLHDGWTVSFWDHVPPPADSRPIDAASFGAMLRDLHAALRGYDGPLEPFGAGGPPIGDIEVYLTQVEAGRRPVSALSGDDIAAIRDEVAQLLFRMPADIQALHGDSHPGNLIPGPAGHLWADFEDSCRGPLAWDLASFARTRKFDPGPGLAAYGDVPDLTDALRLRFLHGLIWWDTFAATDGRHRPVLEDRLRELRGR
jgi:aminoglycoside phosphotransferase (APT) family kinase protein